MMFKTLEVVQDLERPIKVLTGIGEVECTTKNQVLALKFLEKRIKLFSNEDTKYELFQFFMDPNKYYFNGNDMYSLELLSDDLRLHVNLLRLRAHYLFYSHSIKFDFNRLILFNPLSRYVVHEGFVKLPRVIVNEICNFMSQEKMRYGVAIANAIYTYPSITLSNIMNVLGAEPFGAGYKEDMVIDELARLEYNDLIVKSNDDEYYFIGRNPRNRTSKFHWSLEWNFYTDRS